MFEWLKQNSLFIGLLIAISIFFIFMKEDNASLNLEPISATPDPMETEIKEVDDPEIANEDVLVDVKGEVNDPGVYKLTSDSRVNDVIELAGGFTEQAIESSINLAQKVHDEMIIIIPNSEGDNDTSPSASSAPNQSQTDQIRINDASQEEIEALSGIGPSKAEAIFQYREENGLFQSVEDLLNVSGIGEKTLENIRDDIKIP